MADATVAHEEVWDDSALLDSWNEAFAEYKKYHSLAAKGEKISIDAATTSTGLTNGDTPLKATAPPEQAQDQLLDSDEYAPSVGLASKSGQSTGLPQMATPAAAVPQALAASVQDDSLRNAMMSWYYAGYYTGLYEGKQQGHASALQAQHGPEG